MSPDYKYTLNFLNKFIKIIRDNNLEREFYIGSKNFLHTFQNQLFAEIKVFSENKKFKEVENGIVVTLKTFIVQTFLLIFSLFSFLVFLIKRPRVLLYSIDLVSDKEYLRDKRVSFLYKYIYKEERNFLEIMHTLPGEKTLKNLWSRKQPVIYLESIYFLSNLFNFFKYSKNSFSFLEKEALNFEEKQLVNYLLNKYLNKIIQVKINIIFFKILYRFFGLNKAFGIEDLRYMGEILYVGEMLGVETVIVQHGHYTKYHPGFLQGSFAEEEVVKSSKLIVWNEYWKNELLRLGSIWKEGNILFPQTREVAKKAEPFSPLGATKKTHLNILIPYETDCPKQEVKAYIEKFLQAGHEVYFKLRKDREKGVQLEDYGIFTKQDEEKWKNFHGIFDEQEVIEKIDCVCGVYSTYLYDILKFQKPVFILDTSMDYGEGAVSNGLAETLNIEEDLSHRLLKFQFKSTYTENKDKILDLLYNLKHAKN